MNWEKLSFKVYMKPIFFAYFPSLARTFNLVFDVL